MSLEELEKRRSKLKQNSDITINNMQEIVKESERVADVAHNSSKILNELDKEFENMTGLDWHDVKFLLVAVSLQLARIYIANELTKIEKAGESELEDFLHKKQEKILGKFDEGDDVANMIYHASKKLIISTDGVPYDATSTLTQKEIDRRKNTKTENSWGYDYQNYIPDEKLKLFEGANHRFSTLGHDPILGLVFGTGNIMTNTITCVKSPVINMGALEVPILTTNHVLYSDQNKHPMIGTYGSTIVMLGSMINRTIKQPEVLVAALIKQIIHIGTDLYTPCGIQFPAANLILSKTQVENITKYISTGDIVKIGVSMKVAELINYLITAVHQLTYDEEKYKSRDLFSVKTRKIILYSNTIATSSNVILQGAQIMGGNVAAIKDLDLGGLLVLSKRLTSDRAFIRQVKEEFIFRSFNKMIQGDELKLTEIHWD